MGFDLRPLSDALGGEITGIDLGQPVDDATKDALNQALAEHIVLVIRDQSFTPERYLQAVSVFGKPMRQHYSQYLMQDYPDIGLLSSRDSEPGPDGKVAPLGSGCWHTDHTNRDRPPKATLLYALELPSTGGGTSFANMRAAYAAVPEDLKRAYADLKTVNVIDRSVRALPEDAEEYAGGQLHPLVRTHPDNGTKALYFHPTKTERILGMTPEDSHKFIDDLLQRIIRPEIVYSHDWRVGDMVVFDNRACLHKAQADYDLTEGRLLYRVIVEGDRPV